MSRTVFRKKIEGVDFTCFADFTEPVVPDDIPKLTNLEIFVDESRNVIDVLDKSVVTALELEAHERRFDNGIPEVEGERIFSFISVLCRSEVGRRGDAVHKDWDQEQAGQSKRKRDRKRKG